jgi:hypothetical protein
MVHQLEADSAHVVLDVDLERQGAGHGIEGPRGVDHDLLEDVRTPGQEAPGDGHQIGMLGLAEPLHHPGGPRASSGFAPVDGGHFARPPGRNAHDALARLHACPGEVDGAVGVQGKLERVAVDLGAPGNPVPQDDNAGGLRADRDRSSAGEVEVGEEGGDTRAAVEEPRQAGSARAGITGPQGDVAVAVNKGACVCRAEERKGERQGDLAGLVLAEDEHVPRRFDGQGETCRGIPARARG